MSNVAIGPIVYSATGRRKRAIARVRLVPGDGRIIVNKKGYDEHFPRETHHIIIRRPFEHSETIGRFNVYAKVHGGGISAQADALKLGIARALVRFDENLRPSLSKGGFLTRDSREKESKKYGRKRARKGFQWTKR